MVLRLDETRSPQGAIDVPGDDQEEEDVTEVDARVVVGTADVVSTLPGLNLFRTSGTVEFLLPAAAAAAAAGPFFLFLFPSLLLAVTFLLPATTLLAVTFLLVSTFLPVAMFLPPADDIPPLVWSTRSFRFLDGTESASLRQASSLAAPSQDLFESNEVPFEARLSFLPETITPFPFSSTI